MQFKYSKPSIDVSQETTELTKIDNNILETQLEAMKYLKSQPQRKCCLLCLNEFNMADKFLHRGLMYIICNLCHHIQSENMPTPAYPTDTPHGLTFLDIYPKLSAEQYLHRQNRVYKPKRDWIIQSLLDEGYTSSEVKAKNWFEFGAGAGYFLSTLKEYGVKQYKGVEQNSDLCGIANSFIGKDCVFYNQSSLCDAVEKFDADVYVAFFVLEHIQDTYAFFQKLSTCKEGTLFVFSVPVFSFATLLEGAFDHQAGRNLDNALHTQVYTDDSIAYALDMAGFKIINQWLFGQDSADLKRVLSLKLEEKYPKYLADKMKKKLTELLDPIQESIDKVQFCDARHIICIKGQK